MRDMVRMVASPIASLRCLVIVDFSFLDHANTPSEGRAAPGGRRHRRRTSPPSKNSTSPGRRPGPARLCSARSLGARRRQKGMPLLEVVMADLRKLFRVHEVIRVIRVVAFEADLLGNDPANIGSRGRRHVRAPRTVADLTLDVAKRLLRRPDPVPMGRPVPNDMA